MLRQKIVIAKVLAQTSVLSRTAQFAQSLLTLLESADGNFTAAAKESS
ncbi:hypothetical protein Osc1_16360 [Hominimerdicola sp. 21CYCFAH17_S]